VRSRIVGVVVAAVAVALTAGLLGLMALSAATDRTRAMYERHTVAVQLAVEARYQYAAFRFASLNRASAPTPDLEAQYQGQRDDAQAALVAALDGLRARASADGALLPAVAQVHDDVTAYVQATAQLDQLAAAGRVVEFNDLRETQVGPLSGRLLDGLDALSVSAQEEARAAAAGAATAETRMRTLIAVVLGAGALLAMLGGIVVATGISRRLRRTAVARDEALAAVRDLTARVAASADVIAAASAELAAGSEDIADTAGRTTTRSGAVAAAADDVNRSVRTVAAGAEQMGAAIAEIARNADDAVRVAASAVAEVESTTAAVARLGDSSREIGDVVKVITSIAEQTNLLALNATIEAARAGEAGKGFAVVAGEVKELARETATATEDIARRVQAIQGDTSGAVAAIGRISEVIARIDDYQRTIAGAVEQQTATAAVIARSVAEAADGSGRIAATVGEVAEAAGAAGEALGRTRGAVDELDRTAADLREIAARSRH
jgi:methyl-accepting chemotaxis protein